MTAEHHFQVDLGGIIDLLSNHLYSGPEVFLRELLQNGVDAITARKQIEPEHLGTVQIETIRGKGSLPSTLVVQDNGIGLTAEEIHQFLATIGRSSKRESLDREDFIGQFGIGLLSCFVVADEIVVITRSIQPGQQAVEWKGRSDGTYSIRLLDRDYAPGTQVFLQAKPGKESMFENEFVLETLKRYGGHLPIPVWVTSGALKQQINQAPPWQQRFSHEAAQRDAYLDYGYTVFGKRFFDAIPLHSNAGGIEGIAFVLPQEASLAARQTHHVYLKQMLLSERAEKLLPDWAFFVKCVLNTQDLRPTASRESFYDDEHLEAAREELGACLRNYLINLAKVDRQRLDQLIALHFLAFKSLAVEDDDFFEMFIDYLPFETSLGLMSLGDYLKQYPVVKYVDSVDHFRQVAGVAAAQDICLINAGYVHDTSLLEKLADVFPDRQVERLDVSELTNSFEELSLEEHDAAFDFLRTADQVLRRFGCEAELKKFLPDQLPTLYTIDSEAGFRRNLDRTREEADDLWAGVLDGLAASRGPVSSAQMCFNYQNRLVRRLVELNDKVLVRKAVEMLYVQALLLGHYPLRSEELKLMGDGLLGLIDLVIARTGDKSP
jgi:molecular chaperone HtpG